jgi:hypothetical protein
VQPAEHAERQCRGDEERQGEAEGRQGDATAIDERRPAGLQPVSTMEAIIERSQFEGRATYAYEFDAAGGITAVLGAGCGV